MIVKAGRYTSGRIAVAGLSTTIDALERRCAEGATFQDLAALSKSLFVRGDVLGRIHDHDHAERVAHEAMALAPDLATVWYIRARVATRFRRFEEARGLLDRALAGGYPRQEVEAERATLLQAIGSHGDALALREAAAKDHPTIDTLGALASVLAEMDRWSAAETCFAAALDADTGTSPMPCGHLLFEWAVCAMRRGDMDRAEAIFVELDAIVPHVPGRGRRAEVALARGQWDTAMELIGPVVAIADDPEYRATYAAILAARGDFEAATREAERAAAAYELLLVRRPEAYTDDAAAFFLGIGNRPQRAVSLALASWRIHDTPRSRRLLGRAHRRVGMVGCASSDNGFNETFAVAPRAKAEPATPKVHGVNATVPGTECRKIG